ncbi:MAG: energy transducer TonB [Flavobacteriales bacterium]|nr:energy transducer TonB [Flavobacteriales bacterium]
MWRWFDNGLALLLRSTDDGSFFLKPWFAFYRALSLLLFVGGVVMALTLVGTGVTMTYQLHQQELPEASVQTLATSLLMAMALLINGSMGGRLMWLRGSMLWARRDGEGGYHVVLLVADLVRTLGELWGLLVALFSISYFLVLWPAQQAIMAVPFVGHWIGTFISLPFLYPLTGVIVGFLAIFITRWISDYLEIWFRMGNDVRAIRQGGDPVVHSQPSTIGTYATQDVDWRMAGVVSLAYLIVATPLYKAWPLLPAIVMLGSVGLKRWWPGASVMVAFITLLALGLLTGVIARGDTESLVGHFHTAGFKLLLPLFLIGLVAVALSLTELFRTPTKEWSKQSGIATTVILLLLFLVFPVWSTWQEGWKRHDLSAEEERAVRDLFKEYQQKAFAVRQGENYDTVNVITVDQARFQADKYGQITVEHAISWLGTHWSSRFGMHHKSIAIPGFIQYRSKTRGDQLTVSYHPDSLVLLMQNQPLHALPLESVRDRVYGRQRRDRNLAMRDSLQLVRDTLRGKFSSYRCASPPCFAWFEVEQENGSWKRMAFYCERPVISGYPLASMPPDGSIWSLKIRRTLLDGQDPNAEGAIAWELEGMDDPVEPPEPEAVPEPVKNDPPVKTSEKIVVEQQPKAPVEKPVRPTSKVYQKNDVDIEPAFPGGRTGLDRYIRENKRYPAQDRAEGRTGKVRVSFVVGKDGRVKDVRCSRSVSPGLDAEAMRLIREMPAWSPGFMSEGAVDVQMEWTIDFTLNE